jgi:uncharacterized protein YcbX
VAQTAEVTSTSATVVSVHRHPVKSLRGEAVTTAAVTANGLDGDRAWGIQDAGTGKILTGRREPSLLLARATLHDRSPVIELPNGETHTGPGPATDAALSGWLGRPVRLVAATDQPSSTAEYFADATDDTSAAIAWTMPVGRFVDAMPVLLVTTSSLRKGRSLYPDGQWDVARFRPNVLIDLADDGWAEDSWCGRTLHIGTAAITPAAPCERCTMVTRPQPGLARDLEIYKVLARHHGGTFGVWSAVAAPGVISVGDAVKIA